MDLLTKYLFEIWSMTATLAPWLLIGFALAGLISMGLRRSLVTRVLGRPGLGSILKATLVGVPLPICSCGVIPVAAAIREKGAGKGATAAFLASTPSTGVDSAFATWGMLGPLMAVVRIVLAFVSGILAGLFVQFVTREDKEASPTDTRPEPTPAEPRQSSADALKYAFISMPEKMSRSLVLGILLAALVAVLVPDDFFASMGVHGLLAYLIVSIVAVPLYVCSTGSIPLALAMIQAGFSPGAALVFLVTGPATNATTLTTMKKYLGGRGIVAYLLAIVITAWGAGAIVDAGLGRETIMGQMPHNMGSVSLVGGICAVILIVLVLRGLIAKSRAAKAGASCCSTENGGNTSAGTGHSCCCGGEKKAVSPTVLEGDTCCHSKTETAEASKHSCCCGHGTHEEKAVAEPTVSHGGDCCQNSTAGVASVSEKSHSCCCGSNKAAMEDESATGKASSDDGKGENDNPKGGCCCGH